MMKHVTGSVLGGPLLAAAVMLSGCASNAVDLHYYLLHSPSHKPVSPTGQVSKQIRFEQLRLPDYLKQRGLAMQTGPATVYFSSQHVWAEPLNAGLLQSLTDTLWQQEQVQVLPNNIYKARQMPRVDLQIDDLIATHTSDVLLKGHYWVHYPDGESKVHRFDFRAALQQDGFEHTVVKMRELVGQLAADIGKNV
ncbi:PqiC family protein [Salinimonas lutimaris]|uniref:PqiC family protein n=1 Tax=Salinimonas lutimaris TaxID=914153 RepID=UPI0010C09BD3|nr:ABC-type transport auxiliary lipoprotein family protein [Salinimonas lutimaris]